jgi:SAM-dependent methyltransferase
MNGIYHDGRHYDRMFGPDGDTAFLLEQARAVGGPVLELACGTGRVLQAMADAGFAATGIDTAPGMLAEARRKSAAKPAQPRYIDGDMRRFRLDERFSLIFVVNNSLCHLLDIAAFEGCMACVREHLAPGGRFVVDVFVPSFRSLLVDPTQRLPLAEYDDPDGAGRVVVTHQSRYDVVTQIKWTKTFHQRPGQATQIEGSLDMRMYFPQELQALLKYNGFRLVAAFGGYQGEPLASNFPRQIYVLER